jgi:serine/threonine-protein kinase
MSTTTLHDVNATIAFVDEPASELTNELTERYTSVIQEQRLSWTTHQRLIRLLGRGGQGVVFLSERRGADNFTLPVAVKIFSPNRYDSSTAYEQAMERIANVAVKVAQIQQDNLLDVHNFVDRLRIRMMVMEWIDGYDLRRLLSNDLILQIRNRVSEKRWNHISQVIITPSEVQPRVKPGVAVAIVRECLAALAALHREGIVHGDIKPANIMLKCTGNAKIVDIGSAFHVDDPPPLRTCTPTYAAPEVLEGGECTPRSDLASLGYVLIEMLAGRPLFATDASFRQLLQAKRALSKHLDVVVPMEVSCNELLMNFCRGLIAPDPMRRFPSAEAANLLREGAAAFLRQLIMMNLAAEYDNEIRLLLEEIKELDERDGVA